MNKYFNIFLEFDQEKVDSTFIEAIVNKNKAYICVVDGNVLATAHKNIEYRNIINKGLMNLCDGSSIALLVGKIHHKKFQTYTGPDFFSNFVKTNTKQYFLGNTSEILKQLKNKFSKLGYNQDLFQFEPLPFKSVENFNYPLIAEKINEFSPRIIWISLGAPKQEFFIDRLYPYIESGVMVAIGAAFNLFLGEENNKRAPLLLRNIKLEWLYRVIQEPKRVGKRALSYLEVLPQLIFEEIKQVSNAKYDKI